MRLMEKNPKISTHQHISDMSYHGNACQVRVERRPSQRPPIVHTRLYVLCMYACMFHLDTRSFFKCCLHELKSPIDQEAIVKTSLK